MAHPLGQFESEIHRTAPAWEWDAAQGVEGSADRAGAAKRISAQLRHFEQRRELPRR
jgi:hypothetical protein